MIPPFFKTSTACGRVDGLSTVITSVRISQILILKKVVVRIGSL
jgi:hypothetical protein